MSHLVITKWNASTYRVEKSQFFDDAESAAAFAAGNPGSFVIPDENRDPGSLTCDPQAGTVAFDPLPPKTLAAEQKAAIAQAQLNTPFGKALRDWLWELHQVAAGLATFPQGANGNETKAEYVARCADTLAGYQ